MQSSNAPAYLPAPWASAAGAGYIRTIPAASQVGITAGAASLADGFPPLNFTAVSVGGVPPSGADMNGILNLVTKNIQWQQAGGWYQFNGTFANQVGGYPAKAVLVNSAGTGFWWNTVDNNLTNPDVGGTGWNAIGALSCPWSGLTGSAPPISTFSNNVGYVTAAGASSAAPVQAVNGLTGNVSVPTGLSVNAIGYVALVFGGVYGNEGTLTTLPGRPGTWLNSGRGSSGSDQYNLVVRIA